MAKIVIAGAGFAGHFAAMTLSDELRKKGTLKDHEITVVSRQPKFTFIPSLIWVGIGQMKVQSTQFELAKVYKKLGVKFTVGRVFEVHPDEKYILAETEDDPEKKFDFDYLIMATGPFLNFAATPGLGPDNGYTYSVCTPTHAEHTAKKYLELVSRLEKGEKANVVVGTGHGTCTCQGAALEFLFNVHSDLEKRKLRDRVKLTWLSNEPRLGDLGISGVEVKKGPSVFSSEELITGMFEGYGIDWKIRRHVHEVQEKTIQCEDLDGNRDEVPYDFAMLLPPFKGQKITYIDKEGQDITEKMCNPAGFVKVDAVYGKAYPDLDGPDWPKTYQSPVYSNIFAAGIAFAPPGPLSQPGKSPEGTMIAPAPPRTGFTSELCGRAAALNIVEMLEGKTPSHQASMAGTAGICVASMKNSMINGNAIIIGIYPVARNKAQFPEYGRDLDISAVDIGLSGAWIKRGLHYSFLYKLSAKPLWQLLP